MKKIETSNWAFGIGSAVKKVIPTAYTHGVDIYKEDDGSVRILPHKVSFNEAHCLANDFLNKNHVDICHPIISFAHWHTKGKTACIIFDADSNKVKVGTASLNPSDEEDPSIGDALAYSRASGKKLPDDLATYLGINQ